MRALYRTKGFVGGLYGFIARRETGGGSAPVDTLLSIAITPSNPTWRPTASSDRQQFTATGTYSVSGAVDITSSVTWTSGTVGTATISNGVGTQGQATAVATGTSVITATLGAVSGDTTLTVDTDRDATSAIRVPVNAYQWSLGGYTVDGIYLCQEASGNLADSGPGGITLTANATPLYSQAVTGWTRVGVGFNETLNQRFIAAAGTGPSPATVDTFWCWFGTLPSLPAATRTVIVNGTSNNITQLTTGVLRKSNPGFTADDSTTRPDLDDVVHPFGILHDNTSTRAGMFTDEAKTLTTHSAVTDNLKGIGSGTPPTSTWVYGFRFRDAAARLSDADVKALYQWLGFTVPWS